jgi:mono/diheme cytochrome c family protein
MRKLAAFLTLVLLLGLVACGGDDSAPPAEGDPQAGEAVYTEVASPACSFCHSLRPGETIAGPSLAGISGLAGQRVSSKSAEAYLRESIVDPDAYMVEGFGPGIMPSTYATQLSDEQVADLVAYLMTLD